MMMSLEQTSGLPGQAQLWIFGFSQPLSHRDESQIRQALDAFLAQWQSHGAPVSGAYDLFEGRFVRVAGHCPAGISGCSIDSSFQIFKDLQQQGLDGLDRSLIFYRDRQGVIQSVGFQDFQKLVDAGDIELQTRVFDTTLRSLDELRQGGFEVPFERSWHARSFPLSTA